MDHKRDQKPAPIVFLLNLISCLYKLISLINLKFKGLRKNYFKDVTIISIDSLSFGGTGKTPAIMEIGRLLIKNGMKFAIVTRGYKSKAENTSIEVTSTDLAQSVGDEALLFKETFPKMDVFSGKKRLSSIQKAIERGNKVIILDDGFQSTHLQRDIKIMLYNQFHPYYYLRNFRFLSKGEDLIFSYQRSLPPNLLSLSEDGLYSFIIKDVLDKKSRRFSLTNQSILAFSALGDNHRFENSLKKFKVRGFISFQDHHHFTQQDLEELNRQRKDRQISLLLCTHKDFIKIKELNLSNIPLLYITNQIVFSYDLNRYLLEKIT